ncbi:MAG: MmcQ/YjbR family DNA-binding protein [Pseudomonadota bacterium]
MAEKLPGVYQESSYGTPGFKVRKKLLIRLNEKEGAFALKLSSIDEQEFLIESNPTDFYVTDHYKGHPWVLVRPAIDADEFFGLFEQAWRMCALKKDVLAYDNETA